MRNFNIPLALRGALYLLAVVVASILLGTALVALAGCSPFPGTVTPDEAPAAYQAELCLCPDFAVTDHPEDPSEDPGEWCLAKSRTGLWMDAREHPRCQREARERKERRP